MARKSSLGPPPLLDLLIRDGSSAGRRITIDRPILLGRDPRCRLIFDDGQVSRLHGLIEFDGSRAVVRDLGSVNGIYRNGSRITAPEMIHAGDTLRIGRTEIAVVMALAVPPPDPGSIDVPTNADGTGEVPEDSHPSGGGVVLQSAPLSRALEFATQCAGVSRVEEISAWMLPRYCQVFEASGAALLLVPREGAGEPDRPEVLAAHGGGEVSEALLLTHWPLGRPSRAFVRAPAGEVAALSAPVLLRPGGGVVIIAWRGEDRAFTPGEEQLARAIAGALLGGALATLLESLASGGLESSHGANLGLAGGSPAIVRVRQEVRRVAPTNATVLVTGESGTGKEVVARALRDLSPRAQAPYIALNMAAVPADLIEAELFGHEKGAFSGAHERRIGKLEQAHKGTVFLDEIGDLSLDLQAKLLRVLEGHPFYRIGGNMPVRVDVRFICATHRPLERMVERREFRADLFHRINILRIELPALRDRIEDLPDLAAHLLRQIRREHRLPHDFVLKPRTVACLMRYDWPGNVRELRNILEQIVLMADGPELEEVHVPRALRPASATATDPVIKLAERTSEVERREIAHALAECEGVKSRAAAMLGISRPTLDKKIRLYQLEHMVARRAED